MGVSGEKWLQPRGRMLAPVQVGKGVRARAEGVWEVVLLDFIWSLPDTGNTPGFSFS